MSCSKWHVNLFNSGLNLGRVEVYTTERKQQPGEQITSVYLNITERWLFFFFLHVCFFFFLNKWTKELLLLILFLLFVNACFCWVIGLLRPTTQQQIWPKLLFPNSITNMHSVFHINFLFGPLEPLKQGRTQLWVDRPDLLSSWTPSLAKANWMETRRL